MAKKATIKQPGDNQPIDTTRWQQAFPHDLGCTMEFIKDKRGNVDVIITTTDRFNITNRPVEILDPGQLSRVEIHATGYENLPDQGGRNLDHAYFYKLLVSRMINNMARFYPSPEELIQRLVHVLGVDTTTLKGVDSPMDKWRKAKTAAIVEDAKKEAKDKAFRALAAYNYVSFAGWARVWGQMNAISEEGGSSPFSGLAEHARKTLKTPEPKKKV